MLTDLADNYDVVIVDPITSFHGNDENRGSEVNEFLRVFDSLRAAGKGIILVHHTRKLQRNSKGVPLRATVADLRGHGQWFSSVDAVAMHSSTGQPGVTVVDFSFRAAPEIVPLTLYRLPNGGFTDDADLFYADGVQVRL